MFELLEDRRVLSSWSGDISNGTVWSNTEVQRIVGTVRVPAGVTLTIQPGTVIKFNDFAGFSLIVDGTMSAQGTLAQPIYFTSLRDDGVGGDTLGDGQLPVYAGQWDHIQFNSGSAASVLDQVDVRYGGASSMGQVVVNGGTLTLRNSVVRESASDGVRVVNSSPILTNNVYSNNASAAISMDVAANPAISGVTAIGNAINGLQVDAGTIMGNGFWNDPDIVYWLDNDITIPVGSTLTIGSGQVVKFGFFAADLIVNGTLDARGTAAKPIIFTEARDDSAGGDTNNNGAASLPAPANAGRLEFNDSNINSVLEFVEMRYAGSASGSGAVVITNSEPIIRNSTISNSGVDGMQIVASNPVLIGNKFINNVLAAMSMDLASDATILGTTFSNNGVNGVALSGGSLSSDRIWDDSEVVYWLIGPVTVPVGRTLTIKPGQIIKGVFLNSGFLVDGILLAQGTSDQPITITSRDDDTAGGDTNNNGPVSIGLEDWAGIEFRTGSTGSVLDHLDLRYTDSTLGAAGTVRVTNGQATLSNSKIRNAAGFGVAARTTGEIWVTNTQITFSGDSAILAESGGTVTATNNTIDAGARGVVVRTGSTVNLTNNLITNNFSAGIVAENFATITATFNDVFNPGRPNYVGVTDPTGTNGNVSVDPKYFNRTSRQFQLTNGSPAIDAGTSNNAPTTDMFGQARFDDPNVVNRGGGAMPYVDLGASERESISVSDVDLLAFNVTGPTAASQGQVVAVSWTVRNAGTGPAIANWSDAVYLSSEPNWTPNAKFLTRVTRNSDLGPGESYTASSNVTLSNLQPGPNYFIVRTNDLEQVFEGIGIANNAAASSSSLDVAVTPLIVGTPRNDSFTSAGQSKYYQVTVQPGQSLNVALDSAAASGTTELYARRGSLPSRSEFDYRSSNSLQRDPSLVVPSTEAGVYFILVYASTGAAATSAFALTATLGGFDISNVTPATGANSGRVTVAVHGTGLTRATQVSLIALDSTIVNAVATQFQDPTLVFATFDLIGRATGIYDLRAIDGTLNDTSTDSFTVTAGAAGHFTARIVSPDRIRTGFASSITVEYTNDGDADIVTPVLIVQAENAKLRFPNQTEFNGSSLEFLAINTSGPAGVLPPGATGSTKIVFLPSAVGDTRFTLAELEPEKEFDWNAQKDLFRPTDFPTEAWDAVFANLVASVGNTAGSYQSALARDATYLSELGEYVSDTSRLYSFELSRASNFGEIAQRYAIGAFGRGVPDSTMNTATIDAEGNATIKSAGQVRQFFKQRDGSFGSRSGDPGSLARVGGVLRLRESDGTTLVFQAGGLLDYIEDTNGNCLTYSYTDRRLTGISDSLGDQTTFGYNGSNLISQITDAVGRITAFSYDELRRIKTVIDPTGTTQFTYVTGQGAAREHATSRIDFPDGTSQSFEYDLQGRLTRTFSNSGQNEAELSYGLPGGVTVTTASGVTKLLSNDYDKPSVTVDAEGRTTRFFYNADRRIERVIGPDGTTSKIDYDSNGNPITAIDGLGQSLNLVFDQTFNQIASLRNARGQTTQFASDVDGNLTTINHADGSKERFLYDDRGYLSKIIDQLGRSSLYTYNNKAMVSAQQRLGSENASYNYDSHRNLTSISDASGVTLFQYDSADRLTKIIYPGGRLLAFTYDNSNRRTSSTDQSGFKTNYSYDALGRLSELTNSANARIVSYSYDSLSRVTREDRGNGTATEYTYFSDGLVKSIVHRAPDNTIQSIFSYAYGANGLVSSVHTLAGTTNYGYDAAGQLTDISLPNGRMIHYQYDALGNRVSSTDNGVITNYTTNNLDEYTAVGTTTFAYDLAGNLTLKSSANGTTTYGYDGQGRLNRIESATEVVLYEYDALGHLSSTTRNGVKTEYLIDPVGLGDVVGEYNNSGQLVAHYNHGFGLANRVDATGDSNYYSFDAIGNTDQLLGPTGQVVNSYDYLPYGELLSASGGASNPFTFGGRFGVMSAADGHYFMRNRFYDVNVSRFASKDPIGLAGGDLNLYNYAGNNPVSSADPSGLVPFNATIQVAADLAKQAFTIFVDKFGFAAKFAEAPLSPFANKLVNGGGGIYGPFQGLIALEFLVIRDTLGQLTNNDLKTQAVAGGGTIALGWALGEIATVFETIYGAGKISAVLVYTGGSLFVAGGISLAATGGYITGRWLDNSVPIVHKIAERTTGAVVDLFFSPERGKLGDRAKIVQKFCGDLLEDQTEECHRRLAAAGVAQVNPVDPNDIGGPSGFGPQRFVKSDITFPYTILFENKPDATAPAVQVRITQQLDADLDWGTFQVGDFGFGELQVEVPAGRRFFSTRVDYTKVRGEYVDVTAGIDLQTGVATWTFTSIDPTTGQMATDVEAGFLPPNKNATEGDGFVRYTVRAKSSLPTGRAITAQASIVFDTNNPLFTPIFTNTIDTGSPASRVLALPFQIGPAFNVDWLGADEIGGAGIASYSVFVSDNNGRFIAFVTGSTATSAVYMGTVGHTYRFYSLAMDNVGQVEAVPAAFDAQTTVIAAPWQNNRMPTDVDNDTSTSPLDVLLIVNELNSPQYHTLIDARLVARTDSNLPFFDVDGDGFVSPLDALIVINAINRRSSAAEGETSESIRQDLFANAAWIDEWFGERGIDAANAVRSKVRHRYRPTT